MAKLSEFKEGKEEVSIETETGEYLTEASLRGILRYFGADKIQATITPEQPSGQQLGSLYSSEQK